MQQSRKQVNAISVLSFGTVVPIAEKLVIKQSIDGKAQILTRIKERGLQWMLNVFIRPPARDQR